MSNDQRREKAFIVLKPSILITLRRGMFQGLHGDLKGRKKSVAT